MKVNKAVLAVIARLQRLQTPSHMAPGGARVIADLAHPSPLAALLHELNETILGRSLLVESSGGSSLVFDVAGRRILRLRAVNGLAGGDACLAAETLEDEHKDDVLRLMRSLALPRHALRLTSRPLVGAGDGVSVGLPVAVIADLARVELNAVDGPEPDTGDAPPGLDSAASVAAAEAPATAAAAPAAPLLGQFAAALGPALMAWQIKGSDGTWQADGPEELVSPLRGFIEAEAAAVLAQLDRVSARPGDAVCLVLGARLVDGHSIVCARAGDGLLLGVIEGDATPALLQAWAVAQG